MGVKQRANRSARVLFERLPEGVRHRVRAGVADVQGLTQLKRNQALLAAKLAELERRLDERDGLPPAAGPTVADERFAGLSSRLCTAGQFDEPWYAEWCAKVGDTPRHHRKQWEHVYLARAAHDLGLLKPGVRGVGFGVGEEPLVAAFAGHGMEVLATDLDPSDDGSLVWRNTGQHASALDPLRRPDLCKDEDFDRLVAWRPVDMRAVPADLQGFDLAWSSCCFEHLGSLQAGFDFVKASLGTLKPGGYALHTTEFNLSSDDDTIESGPTVLYRAKDIERFIRDLEFDGHEVAALDLDPGDRLLDHYVDLPPYVDEPHLRVHHGKYTLTSVALLIRKAG